MMGVSFCKRRIKTQLQRGKKVDLRRAAVMRRALRSAEQLFFEVADDLADVRVHFHAVFDEATGMEDRAVVTPAKGFANGVERAFCHLAREKHGDLSWESDVL